MSRFVLTRLASGAALLLAVCTLTFFMVFGDPAATVRNLLGEGATEEQVQARIGALGLDRPVPVQFVEWLAGAVRGDLGTSFFTGEPVTETLLSRTPVTLSVVGVAMLVTTLVAVGLGILAAVRGGAVDRAVQVLSVAGLSLPNFWLGTVLVLLFAVQLPLLPATGYVAPDVSLGGWAASLVLPVTALALAAVAAATQQVRGAVVDVLGADFVRTLRSRGLPERSILFRHALKNAAAPALTVLSVQFIGLFSGAVVIEKVFALPGLGSLAVTATLQNDTPVVLGVVVVAVLLVVLVNLLIDLANGWVNPKVRMS